MKLSETDKRKIASALAPDSTFDRFSKVLWAVWVLVSLYLSGYAAEYLFLARLYGPLRVFREGLYIAVPGNEKKGLDMIISNGDHRSCLDGFFVVVIWTGVWLALSLIGYLVLRALSRRRRAARLREVIEADYP